MKRLLPAAFLLFIGPCFATAQHIANVWQPAAGNTNSHARPLFEPASYIAYTLDLNAFKEELALVPAEETKAMTINLPTPDGDQRTFRVWEKPIMESGLAAKYPHLKTYSAVAVDDPRVTAKLDITESGFHAMVFAGAKTYLLDPYSKDTKDSYLCYYKRDYVRPANDRMNCMVADEQELETASAMSLTNTGLPHVQWKVNGSLRRSYRLALAATGEYSVAVAGANPTKAAVLSAMVTTMNRVNGVYEREVNVTMVLVNNTDDLIFLTTNDGYSNGSGSTMLSENQKKVDSVIGPANYDIGHVFSTGGGGIGSLGSVCNFGQKAKGVTGQANPIGDAFDIDYVAHEMGHQFGATHTFNVNVSAGSCTNNATQISAYEPGGGSTIMAYAGICGNANNLQQRSDDYFHAKSLDQISNFLISGGTCGAASPSPNTPPVVPVFTQNYFVPFLTPFELTAPEAVDTDHELLTYCWEQWDLGDYGQSFSNTSQFGPIFRSFKPTISRTRVFPAPDKLVKNITSYTGEKLPDGARNLTFRLTVRDILNGHGAFNFPNDEINLNVVNTGVPFTVTSPDSTLNYWQIGTSVTVAWDVANTNAAPINCSAVDIFLSVDSGYTFPYVLATGTPNDGSEVVIVPFAPTSSARIKVKGSNNVFFALNSRPFQIDTWPAAVNNVAQPGQIDIYPNPASEALNIYIHSDQPYSATVTNSLGQNVLTAEMVRSMELEVSGWAQGVYYLQLINKSDKQRTVKKFVVD